MGTWGSEEEGPVLEFREEEGQSWKRHEWVKAERGMGGAGVYREEP